MRRSKRLQASQTESDDRQEDTVERNVTSDHENGSEDEGDGGEATVGHDPDTS